MEYTQYKLSNGLTVLLDSMPQIETVSIRILFKVGSRNEENSIDGISHILEHMCFKGTENRTAKDIAKEFDMIGGYLNAYTGKERTVYHAKVLKEDIKTALNILSDILIYSIHPEFELNKEKNVIIQEISDAEDDPEDVLFEALFKKAFEGDQFSKPVAGTPDSVSSCTRNDLLKYIEQYYHPENAYISVSGNFNENEIISYMENYFKHWQASENKIFQNNTQPKYIGGNIRVTKSIEQAHVAIAFEGSPITNDSEYYVQQVASLIAGGSMSSRLFQEVRENRGLAYSISSFCSNYTDCGLWGVYASTEPKSLQELVEVTIDELKKMTENIQEEEITIAKAQIKSSLLMSMESSSNRAEKLVNNIATFNRVISNTEIVKAIEAITIDSVKECMKKLLQSTCTVSAVGQIDSLQSYQEIIARLTS